jgi:hypothetical protein
LTSAGEFFIIPPYFANNAPSEGEVSFARAEVIWALNGFQGVTYAEEIEALRILA